MNENNKRTAELQSQKNSLTQSISENEARLTWEKKSIQDGEFLLKSQLSAASEAEKATESEVSSREQLLAATQKAEQLQTEA
jgi:hypothetical protein